MRRSTASTSVSPSRTARTSASTSSGAPTVILAKTVKGWTLGPSVEARNITHQAKKMSIDDLKYFRDRLQLPIPDADLAEVPYFHPGEDDDAVKYMKWRRETLGGFLPKRVVRTPTLEPPAAKA